MGLGSTSKNYVAYAKVYDDLKGDRSENTYRLEYLIRKHHPGARTLLDLACGTGSIAQGLAKDFAIVGVDNAPGMLQIAKAKLPHLKWIQANMTHFTLHQKFDVVYCLHNSMNHLVTFKEWEDTFLTVAAHLHKGGLFIFDSNPPQKMDSLVQAGLMVSQAGRHYVISKVTKNARNPAQYQWDQNVMVRQSEGMFKNHHEPVLVSTYPSDQVIHALTKHFTIADFFVVEETQSGDEFGRAYFVGAKK